jgi:hypothetical protein
MIGGKMLVIANGPEAWSEASTVGNPNQTGVVYFETNTWINRNIGYGLAIDAGDGDGGGRYVFRYSTVYDEQVEIHSCRGPTESRGGKSWEIYENDFWRTPVGALNEAIWQRSGTGVIYNNRFHGNFAEPIILDNVRSFRVIPPPAGGCDGNHYYDGNSANVGFGWPCRDQIGRGPDSFFWSNQPNRPAPSQPSEPLYIWNNTINGSPVTDVGIVNNTHRIKPGGSSHDIVYGRDYKFEARPGYRAFPYPYPGSHTDVNP